ncbi:hypothetical protein KJ632_02130 [Patescibacteria group bacterium]|nr:hypothetical protein [Patescibacteria group bacterium]
MREKNFTSRLKALPLKEKAVFMGSFLLMIATVLPWYNDLDRFNYGDSFLGITGPLYLAGLLVFASAAASFGILLMKTLGRDLPKLPLKESQVHIAGGALSLLMLILTNSVYFHPKFGVNLTEKTMGLGMYIAFAGVGMIILGSFMVVKRNISVGIGELEDEGKIEPLIDMNERTPAGIDDSDVDIDAMIDNIQKTTNDIHDKQN